MLPDKPASVFLDLIPGSLWIALRAGLVGRSPIRHWVRRCRRQLLAACVTMPGAALLSAKIEALGFVPTDAPGALWPVLSAAIAGAFTVSPRLQLETLVLVRVVKSAVTTVLAAIGAAVAAMVLFRDKLDPLPAWTLDETVTHLQAAAPTIVSFLLTVWLILCVACIASGFRFGPPRSAVLFDRRMAARHEAAHALVATVLGLPVEGAWVPHCPDERGIGGTVRLEMPPVASTTAALYGLLIRRTAVNVAGVAGARGKRSLQDVLRELTRQNDWVQATELSWVGASLHPDQVLVWNVLVAVISELHTAPWTSAIAAAAETLLHAAGDSVSPEAFAAIARRFGLALPAVETLAAALPNPPAREIVT